MSSYPTSVSGIIVLLNPKHWIKVSRILFSTDSSFLPLAVIKLSVSVFGQTTCTGYRIYTVSREPIRLLEIQYLVFGI